MSHKYIAIASMDKDFVDAAKVFIHTFKCNNPDIPINMYILDDYTPDEDMLNLYPDVTFKYINNNRVKQFLTENKNEINITSFDGNMYDSSKLICMFSYLEAVDELIAENKYDVIIKADLDTLWCGSIANDLIEFTKSNLPIAVSEEAIPEKHYELGSNGLLPYYINTGYCNVGITLYNAKIIDSNIFDTIVNTMKKYSMTKFVFLDQDALLLSYPERFLLKGVYNSTSVPVPDAKDIYVLHYNCPFKPFGKITKKNIKKYYSDFTNTYRLYHDIAKTVKCSDTFINHIATNLDTLNKNAVHNKFTYPGRKIIQFKCTTTLKALTGSL